MDRDALVRASRRREVLDALAFERDRAALLATQLEDVLAEADGARLDADLFAQMSPDDAVLVQVALGEGVDADGDEEGEPDDDFGFPLDFDDVPADPDENGVELEIARLEGELELSRRIQAALERYLDLLSG